MDIDSFCDRFLEGLDKYATVTATVVIALAVIMLIAQIIRVWV